MEALVKKDIKLIRWLFGILTIFSFIELFFITPQGIIVNSIQILTFVLTLMLGLLIAIGVFPFKSYEDFKNE